MSHITYEGQGSPTKRKEKTDMRKVVSKLDEMLIGMKVRLAQKKPAVDQIIIMFIIIAVAAGIAGFLYIFGTKTLLPNFQNKITTLINQWFDGK